MKRSLTLLLTLALLVCSLTACGGNDDQRDQNNDTVMDGEAADNGTTANNGTTDNDTADNNGTTNGDSTTNGTTNGMTNGTGDSLLDDAGDAIHNGVDDVEDTLTGDDNATTRSSTTGGISYRQMLENGRVHDTDGDLTDHENAMTPGGLL
jgi:hypothetical protein